MSSGVTGGLSQGGNTAGGDPLVNSKKSREMIVNAEADGYTKTLHIREILRKTQKRATY